MATPATRRPLGAIPALLLVAIAIWEIAATRCQATSVPGDDAWIEASKIVRTHHQPGDLIVFAPAWIDPVGRLHLGDLIPVETAARMDAAKYGRIWELSIRDAVAPDVLGMTATKTYPGPVDVRFYQRRPVTVITELISYAPAAGRLDLVEVGFEPHRCLVVPVSPARPYLRDLFAQLDRLPDQARAKLIRAFAQLLPELPAAAAMPAADRDGKWIAIHMTLGSNLAGAFGIADIFTRRDERRDIGLVVEIDGKQVLETVAPIDRWVPFETPTSPGDHQVRIRLRWKANPGETTGVKTVCVNAEARR